MALNDLVHISKCQFWVELTSNLDLLLSKKKHGFEFSFIEKCSHCMFLNCNKVRLNLDHIFVVSSCPGPL